MSELSLQGAGSQQQQCSTLDRSCVVNQLTRLYAYRWGRRHGIVPRSGTLQVPPSPLLCMMNSPHLDPSWTGGGQHAWQALAVTSVRACAAHRHWCMHDGLYMVTIQAMPGGCSEPVLNTVDALLLVR